MGRNVALASSKPRINRVIKKTARWEISILKWNDNSSENIFFSFFLVVNKETRGGKKVSNPGINGESCEIFHQTLFPQILI